MEVEMERRIQVLPSVQSCKLLCGWEGWVKKPGIKYDLDNSNPEQ